MPNDHKQGKVKKKYRRLLERDTTTGPTSDSLAQATERSEFWWQCYFARFIPLRPVWKMSKGALWGSDVNYKKLTFWLT